MTLGEFTSLQRGHDLPVQKRRDGSVSILGSFGITGWDDESPVVGTGASLAASKSNPRGLFLPEPKRLVARFAEGHFNVIPEMAPAWYLRNNW